LTLPPSSTLDAAALEALTGRRIRVAGHFVDPVTLDGVEDLGDAVSIRVRAPDGGLHETVLDLEELADGTVVAADEGLRLVNGGELFDLVEAQRIEHAYAHDPNFAVSMSGVRGLPHQIVAVYKHMLPQPRLRFVLADDPGAGKTIMAGLLLKELRLRMVADRILILCPAPLTFQWYDELRDKFDETFAIVDSHAQRLGQVPWLEHDRCIASIDFAKRDEVLPDLLRADWDLVIVDEAHKCSAASRYDATEGRTRLDRTKRYTLAEELSRRTERLLLMTATPHSGDTSRFHNFLRLLDPDQFALDEQAAKQIAADDSPYFLRREKEMLKDEHGNDLFVPRDVLTQPFRLGPAELRLYEAVTEYIQDYLGSAGGGRGNAIALARTVLQRRLASSLGAIRSSLRKRADRIAARLAELESLPPAEQAKRLRELRLAEPLDSEQEPDDATEEQEELAVEGVVVAETLDGMRTEIAALERLVVQADQTIAGGEEAKLVALRDCLQKAELAELRDVGATTLDRQVLLFVQHLTEAVNQAPRAALVYSLQASVGEAVGEEALLDQLEKIAGRIDERREPVSGDEVLRVVQRRLFAEAGAEDVRREVARHYGGLLAEQLAAGAETDADRREAATAGEALEGRILESYPFHPELLDLMFHRWGSLPSYQRTRGALQFLATVVHALWAGRAEREPQALIGPGDVDLADEGSRMTFLEQVGETEQYRSVVEADFLTGDAGTRQVDERLGRDAPGLERLRVGTRVATAIMLLSFGAREGADRGALEREVIEASLVPGVDRHVLLSALEAMRGEALLYLHHVAGRYRFEPRPNLNRLIQQEQDRVNRDDVFARVRDRLEGALGAAGPERRHVVLWPSTPAEVPDEGDAFRVVYLPPDWSPSSAPLERWVLDGSSGPRVNRNALGLVEPASDRFDAARAAARRALAVEALLSQGGKLQLSAEQRDELKERLGAADKDVRSALGHSYVRVQVPTGLADDGSIRFAARELETILAAGRGLHERVREALDTHVATKVFPAKVAALAGLSEEREWRWVSEVADALPRYFESPKVWAPEALALGIADGVHQGTFGYVAGATVAPEGGSLQVPAPSAVRLREAVAAESLGLAEGAALLRVGFAERLRAPADVPVPSVPPVAPPADVAHPGLSAQATEASGVRLTITATEDDLFVLSQSLTKLRDLVGGGTLRLNLTVDARTVGGAAIDRVRARNTVIEPLEEDPDVGVQADWLNDGD